MVLLWFFCTFSTSVLPSLLWFDDNMAYRNKNENNLWIIYSSIICFGNVLYYFVYIFLKLSAFYLLTSIGQNSVNQLNL